MRRFFDPLLTRLARRCNPPRDLERYPDRAASPYVLPWVEGEAYLCVQGNNGSMSHFGWQEYSYDFLMLSGTPLLAARAGVVVELKQDSNYIGRAHFNNYVRVEHEDGTVASYLHLSRNSVQVALGERVEQRQPLAASGWTGYSAIPHLHFHVTDEQDGDTIPLAFRDVVEDEGVPRSFRFYRAGPLE